jgi:hypothetical protein
MSAVSPNGCRSGVDSDLLGRYNVTPAVFDARLRDHGGSIVNIGAPVEPRGVGYQALVVTAKSGVDSLTRTGAVEWGPYGIWVNAIAPDSTPGTSGVTRLAETVPGGVPSTPTNPFGRQGRDSDVAYLALCGLTPSEPLAARGVRGEVPTARGSRDPVSRPPARSGRPMGHRAGPWGRRSDRRRGGRRIAPMFRIVWQPPGPGRRDHRSPRPLTWQARWRGESRWVPV